VPPHCHANETREPCGVPLNGQREKIDSWRTSAGRDADSAVMSCRFRSQVMPIPQPGHAEPAAMSCLRYPRADLAQALLPLGPQGKRFDAERVEKLFVAVKVDGRHLALSLPRCAELAGIEETQS
jgi:hypothetical protein